MKVRAKHWVKYNDAWHQCGEEFSIDEQDAEAMKEYTEIVSSESEEPESGEHVRRGRKRKTEE